MSFIPVRGSLERELSLEETQEWTAEMQAEEEAMLEEEQRQRDEWPHYVPPGLVPSISEVPWNEGLLRRHGTLVPNYNVSPDEPKESQDDSHVVPSLSQKA